MSAILAKILNSTVGSSTITPLDTLLGTVANNAADRLYTKLKADVKLVGSEEVLYNYTGGWTSYNVNSTGKWLGFDNERRMNKYISFSSSGTVVLKPTIVNSNSASTSYLVEVRNSSGTAVFSQYFALVANTTAAISVPINVVAGTKYMMAIGSNSNISNVTNLNACATPVQFGVTTTESTS